MEKEEPKMNADTVWLGDLSGFSFVYDDTALELYHRCGWNVVINHHDNYLGNIVAIATGHKDCRPHQHVPAADSLPGRLRAKHQREGDSIK